MEYHVFKYPYVLIEDEGGRFQPFFREYKGATKETQLPVVALQPDAARARRKREGSERKPGICELCLVRYADYSKHISDSAHISTAKETAVYAGVDGLIQSLEGRRRGGKTRKRLFLSSE